MRATRPVSCIACALDRQAPQNCVSMLSLPAAPASGTMCARSPPPPFTIVHLGPTGCAADSSATARCDGAPPERQLSQQQWDMLHGMAAGLLAPSERLSAAAAAKLGDARRWPAGSVIKSLPVELLYDAAGLRLFDEVRGTCGAVWCRACGVEWAWRAAGVACSSHLPAPVVAQLARVARTASRPVCIHTHPSSLPAPPPQTHACAHAHMRTFHTHTRAHARTHMRTSHARVRAHTCTHTQITRLPEYYLTTAEADILARHGPAIVDACVAPDNALLVELGAGCEGKRGRRAGLDHPATRVRL
jgi:hypothetical protein